MSAPPHSGCGWHGEGQGLFWLRCGHAGLGEQGSDGHREADCKPFTRAWRDALSVKGRGNPDPRFPKGTSFPQPVSVLPAEPREKWQQNLGHLGSPHGCPECVLLSLLFAPDGETPSLAKPPHVPSLPCPPVLGVCVHPPSPAWGSPSCSACTAPTSHPFPGVQGPDSPRIPNLTPAPPLLHASCHTPLVSCWNLSPPPPSFLPSCPQQLPRGTGRGFSKGELLAPQLHLQEGAPHGSLSSQGLPDPHPCHPLLHPIFGALPHPSKPTSAVPASGPLHCLQAAFLAPSQLPLLPRSPLLGEPSLPSVAPSGFPPALGPSLAPPSALCPEAARVPLHLPPASRTSTEVPWVSALSKCPRGAAVFAPRPWSSKLGDPTSPLPWPRPPPILATPHADVPAGHAPYIIPGGSSRLA